ncbi:MAG: dTMP kinase [Nitrospinae bacterium]|nr:dTMP kinase [Nitrospinota bacterium]
MNAEPESLPKGDAVELDRGYLIVFEGIDGTGKSTHCRLLADYLESRGIPAVCLSEPTRGPWGMKIRKILSEGRNGISPEDELALFVNDRKEDVDLNIKPVLEMKKAVLIDRYYYSTAAYQGALGLDPDKICRENESFAPRPDLVFIFEAPPEKCLQRIKEDRHGGPNAFEQLEYLKKVQSLFGSFSGPHIRRIDSQPAREAVHARLRREVDELFNLSAKNS